MASAYSKRKHVLRQALGGRSFLFAKAMATRVSWYAKCFFRMPMDAYALYDRLPSLADAKNDVAPVSARHNY